MAETTNLLGGLIKIDHANLHETLNLAPFANHDHANDHGPAVTVGPLSFFQTDGPGEDVQHPVLGDDVHHVVLGLFGLDDI